MRTTAGILDQRRTAREGIGIAVLAGVYLASAWATRVGMVDDAYVSARYARLWTHGCGLRFNCEGPPVEGFTNFLWVVLLAPGTLLPIHLADWATGLGLAFGVATVLGTRWVARARGASAPSAWFAGLLVAGLPAFGVASTNGLETSLFTALLLLAVARAGVRGRDAGVWSALLYLVRPEGLVVGGILAATTRSFRTVATWAGMAAAYFLARWAWFGTLGPNTWAAQAREGALGMWEMNEPYLAAGAPTFAGFGALLVVAAFGPGRDLAGIAVGLSVLALQVYNWMPGLRLFVAPMVLVAVAAAPVLARRPSLWIPVGLWWLWLQGPPRHDQVVYDLHNTVLPGNGGEELGTLIATSAPAGSWLLIRDAGVVAYYAGPMVNVIDMHPFSLTDPVLTGRPWAPHHLLDRDVAYVVTTGHTAEESSQYPAETRLLTDPRLAGFRRIAAWNQHHRRWYTLFARADCVPRLP